MFIDKCDLCLTRAASSEHFITVLLRISFGNVISIGDYEGVDCNVGLFVDEDESDWTKDVFD